MAQTLLSNGYSEEQLKVLRGGYISWQSLGYPVTTSEAPAGGASGASPIQVAPGGGGVTIVTPVPGGAPAAP